VISARSTFRKVFFGIQDELCDNDQEAYIFGELVIENLWYSFVPNARSHQSALEQKEPGRDVGTFSPTIRATHVEMIGTRGGHALAATKSEAPASTSAKKRRKP
jgi:hypothetical protein